MSTKAKESPQVVRARKKIQQQMEKAERLTNLEGLKKMRLLIERQLSRKQTERIDLRSKHVKMFDENTHPAKSQNRFVTRLIHQLKSPPIQPKRKHLEGRIKALQETDG